MASVQPLAAVVGTDTAPRPTVVKLLWDHIKGRDLQNPSDKREIMCDDALRAVFGKDKVTMFSMNKELSACVFYFYFNFPLAPQVNVPR